MLVKAGHMVGKSHGAAGYALTWLSLFEDSGVVVLGPSLQQVRRAVWKEVLKARNGSPLLRLAGKLSRTPMSLEYDEGWSLIGLSGTEPERLQGFHPAGPVLAIVDEASGVNNPDVNAALNSLKPVKRLDITNPLKGYGEFFESWQRGQDDPTYRCITIPSTESPDIHLEHSPRGLADASWLRGMLADYRGANNTIRVRVKAEFPEGDDDLLIPSDWINQCGRALHVPDGPLSLTMDLAKGSGGDSATELVRDKNGIKHFAASNRRTLEDSAKHAKKLSERFGIPPSRIVYDAKGLGTDFDLRLRNEGLVGCIPYDGSRATKHPKYVRYRHYSHYMMRQRLDPERTNPDGSPRPLFHLHPELLARFRAECRAITTESGDLGRQYVIDGDDLKAAIGHSPDYSATLAMSFAYFD